MDKITWKQFELINDPNQTSSFEKMTRIFFKKVVIKNPSYPLPSKSANHPGLETDPVIVGGKKVGFQSKYTSGSNANSLFIESLEIVKKHYKGNLDEIYFFTNAGAGEKTENYSKVISLCKEIGAKPFFYDGDSILDPIRTEKNFESTRQLFFNVGQFEDSWFKKQVQGSLKKQPDKYSRKLTHIKIVPNECVSDDIFYNDFNENSKEILGTIKTNLNQLMKQAKKDDVLLEKVKSFVCDFFLSISKKAEFRKWYKNVENLEKMIKETESSIVASCGESKVSNKTIESFEKCEHFSDELKYALDRKVIHSVANAHIIEAGFGLGKTYFLMRAADRIVENNGRTILLYGDEFRFNESQLEDEIMLCLHLQNMSFDSFLGALESQGEDDGKTTFIMIDALNECSQHKKWKESLGYLVEKINECEYVKLIVSLRSNYSELCLGNGIKTLEKDLKLTIDSLQGFSYYSHTIDTFFEKHNIRYGEISPSAKKSLCNPLIMKLFCKVHENDNVSFIDDWCVVDILNQYLNKEARKFEENNNGLILDFNSTIKEIGGYCSKNYTRTIPLGIAIQLLKSKGLNDANLTYLYKSDVLKDSEDEKGNREISFYYELFLDKAIADSIIVDDRNKAIENFENFVGDGSKVSDVISSISLLTSAFMRKHDQNMDESIKRIQGRTDSKIFTSLFETYITAYIDFTFFDIDDFYTRFSNYFSNNRELYYALWFKIYDYDLNEKAGLVLDSFLRPMTLSSRDYYWTIFINNQCNSESNTVPLFLHSVQSIDFNFLTKEKAKTTLSYLVWLLTSTNRSLRDVTTKTITKILKVHTCLLCEFLDNYLTVNDPYVVSRVLASVYGALVNCNVDNQTLKEIASSVFNHIFSNGVPAEDIQIRDYARDIIEYAKHKKVSFGFNVKKCYPPYNSFDVPNISLKNVTKLYPKPVVGYNIYSVGTEIIRDSLAPETKIKGLTDKGAMIYGDFGRYIFESAINEFDGIDKQKVFKYAFYYIVNTLGYSNALFSEFDSSVSQFRGSQEQERIGKKYEWLALYHVLAKVSDNHSLKSFCSEKVCRYKGTWEPYLRDFDPTQLRENNGPFYSGVLDANVDAFDEWDLECADWINTHSNYFKYKDLCLLKDKKTNNEWVAIYAYRTEGSEQENCCGLKQLLRSYTSAYVLKADEIKKIIGHLDECNIFYNSANIDSNYRLYSRDYTNSDAYLDIYGSIPTQETIVINKSNDTINQENLDIKNSVVAHLYNLSHEYLWETGYDYSTEEDVRYIVPSKYLLDMLELSQVDTGLWEDSNGIIQAVEAGFLKELRDTNIKGLFVRKEYLFEKMSSDLAIIWLIKTEALSPKLKQPNSYEQVQKDSLCFYDDKGNFQFLERKSEW